MSWLVDVIYGDKWQNTFHKQQMHIWHEVLANIEIQTHRERGRRRETRILKKTEHKRRRQSTAGNQSTCLYAKHNLDSPAENLSNGEKTQSKQWQKYDEEKAAHTHTQRYIFWLKWCAYRIWFMTSVFFSLWMLLLLLSGIGTLKHTAHRMWKKESKKQNGKLLICKIPATKHFWRKPEKCWKHYSNM